MKVVLMGTPYFAVPTLEKILSSHHTLLAVISQPDKAKDRKGNLIFTPLKAAALEKGIKVYQFNSLKNEGIATLKDLNADIFVTVAYGQILSQEILDIPKYGVINIHASLLPKYRGSSPIEHAILNGDSETGVTIMQTVRGLDAGDMILSAKTLIDKNESSQSLSERLSMMGADLLITALDDIENNRAVFTPQDEDDATKCCKITKDMCKINWNDTALNIHNKIRALPAFTTFKGRIVKLLQSAVLDIEMKNGIKYGEFLQEKDLKVCCKKGVIEVLRLIPEGGKPMNGRDFLLGIRSNELPLKFE